MRIHADHASACLVVSDGKIENTRNITARLTQNTEAS